MVAGNSHARKSRAAGRHTGGWAARVFSVSGHRHNPSQGTGSAWTRLVRRMYPLRSLSLTLRPHRPPPAQHHRRGTAGGHLQE